MPVQVPTPSVDDYKISGQRKKARVSVQGSDQRLIILCPAGPQNLSPAHKTWVRCRSLWWEEKLEKHKMQTKGPSFADVRSGLLLVDIPWTDLTKWPLISPIRRQDFESEQRRRVGVRGGRRFGFCFSKFSDPPTFFCHSIRDASRGNYSLPDVSVRNFLLYGKRLNPHSMFDFVCFIISIGDDVPWWHFRRLSLKKDFSHAVLVPNVNFLVGIVVLDGPLSGTLHQSRHNPILFSFLQLNDFQHGRRYELFNCLQRHW